MTLGELRDILADISDESELLTDVYFIKSDHECRLVTNVFVDDDGDIIIQ